MYLLDAPQIHLFGLALAVCPFAIHVVPASVSPSINALSSAVSVFLSFDLMWLATLSHAVLFSPLAPRDVDDFFLQGTAGADSMMRCGEDIDAHG